MIAIYFLIYAVVYGVPVLVAFAAAWVLQRFAFPSFGMWRWTLAGFVVLTIGCLPTLYDRFGMWRAHVQLEAHEIRPSGLDLAPARLLILEGNSAGIGCGWDCSPDLFPFATDMRREPVTHAFQTNGQSDVLPKQDLWHLIDNPDRTQPYPYTHLFLSMPYYYFMNYRVAVDLLPDGVHGVHILTNIPEDGVFDITTAEITYLRYNLQRDIIEYPVFVLSARTVHSPSMDQILSDLAGLTR